jgi:hypothetical protein
MASNIWVWYVLALKVYHKLFSSTDEGCRLQISDHDYYKSLTGVITLIFLIPLILKMAFKINTSNFCSYLALVNFVAYNFGYHVHEKAIQMVYIPLLV